jgi:hypothetical protein
MLKRIRTAANELAVLINKYSSFDLTARLWFSNGLFNGDTYRESESTQRPHCIEYAALAELKNREHRLKHPLVVDTRDVLRAQELIEEIYRNTVWHNIAKRVKPGNLEPPDPLETATFFGALRKMIVGPSAYWQHWTEVLNGLFDGPLVRDTVASALGISYKSVLQVATAISEGMATRVVERLKEVAVQSERIQRDLAVYISTGKNNGDADGKAVLDKLRDMRSKDRKRCLQNMLMQWAFIAFADQLSFTVASLSESTGIAPSTVESFLKIFQTELGST